MSSQTSGKPCNHEKVVHEHHDGDEYAENLNSWNSGCNIRRECRSRCHGSDEHRSSGVIVRVVQTGFESIATYADSLAGILKRIIKYEDVVNAYTQDDEDGQELQDTYGF